MITVVDGRHNDRRQREVHRFEFERKAAAWTSRAVPGHGQVQPVDGQSQSTVHPTERP